MLPVRSSCSFTKNASVKQQLEKRRSGAQSSFRQDLSIGSSSPNVLMNKRLTGLCVVMYSKELLARN